MESILTSIKKLLGIGDDDTSFDDDIIMDINTEFMALSQLGVGPFEGFSITDKTTTWSDYLGSDAVNLQGIKTYIYMKVRLVFDPPSSSFVLEAMQRQIDELTWRINIQAEGGTASG